MGKITNGETCHYLSLDTHRASWPVVRWIEEAIAEGRATNNEEYGIDTIYAVKVQSGPGAVDLEKEEFLYIVEKGKVVALDLYKEGYFSDIANPTADELSILEMVDVRLYKSLRFTAMFIRGGLFDKPHSCRLIYLEEEKECCGCGKWGEVNYSSGSEMLYYCGGGPRCCP